MSGTGEVAWREPPTPLQALRAAGLDAAGARLTDLSRSHSVHLAVLPDTSAYVVKRLRRKSWGEGRSLAAELYAYRLSGWRKGLDTVLPRPLLLDERRQVLVLDRAPGVSPPAGTAALTWGLGLAIATWHRATAGLPLPRAAAAGVLHMPETATAGWGLTVAAARELGERIVADDLLRGILTAGAAAWRPRCLVHADLKWDNCLVDQGHREARIRVIDWELSGSGDPAWDVGCAIAEDLLTSTDDMAGAAALASAYSASQGLVDDGFWQRCAVFCVARLLHLGLECASFHGDADSAWAHVETARRFGTDPGRLADRLRASADPLERP